MNEDDEELRRLRSLLAIRDDELRRMRLELEEKNRLIVELERKVAETRSELSSTRCVTVAGSDARVSLDSNLELSMESNDLDTELMINDLGTRFSRMIVSSDEEDEEEATAGALYFTGGDRHAECSMECHSSQLNVDSDNNENQLNRTPPPPSTPAHRTPPASARQLTTHRQKHTQSAKKSKQLVEEERLKELFVRTQVQLDSPNVTVPQVIDIWLQRVKASQNEWMDTRTNASITRLIKRIRPKDASDDAAFVDAVERHWSEVRALAEHACVRTDGLRKRLRDAIRRLWLSDTPQWKLGALQLLFYNHSTLQVAPRILTHHFDGDGEHTAAFFYFPIPDKELREGREHYGVPRLVPLLLFSVDELAALGITRDSMDRVIRTPYVGLYKKKVAMQGFQTINKHNELKRMLHHLFFGSQEEEEQQGQHGKTADTSNPFVNWNRRLGILTLDLAMDDPDSRWLRAFVRHYLPRGRIQLFNLALGHTSRSPEWKSYFVYKS